MSPLVAVIIPTFNREHLLERAVQSVLDQTLHDFELVVVDDGSADRTAELPVLKIAGARLKYLRFPENRGVSAARNAGVKATSAPWIAFLDSDDEWLPRKLERQVDWTNANQDSRIVQTREFWIRRGRRVNPPKTHEKSGGDIFAASLERCMITPSSVMLRRSLFEKTGGFDESLPACEDYDLWLRITCRCPAGLVDEYLLKRYGGHADQLSSIVPALDRFRVLSIQKLLSDKTLDAGKKRLAEKILVKKAAVLAEGCRKRGKTEEYEQYKRIIAQYG